MAQHTEMTKRPIQEGWMEKKNSVYLQITILPRENPKDLNC